MCRNRVHQHGTPGEAAACDLEAKRRECICDVPLFVQSAISKSINDSRDQPVALLLLNIICLVVPSVLFLFLAPESHALGAVYLAANYAFFLTRFLVALLHVTEHRHLFKPGVHT